MDEVTVVCKAEGIKADVLALAVLLDGGLGGSGLGAPAAPPTTMNVLVDQKGEITMPLLLQEPVVCDGLTLEALKQKLVKDSPLPV